MNNEEIPNNENLQLKENNIKFKKNENINDISNIEKDSDNVIYDLIIDTKSIVSLPSGWKIDFMGNDFNKARIRKRMDEKSICVSVIGNSNRGKTFMIIIY